MPGSRWRRRGARPKSFPTDWSAVMQRHDPVGPLLGMDQFCAEPMCASNGSSKGPRKQLSNQLVEDVARRAPLTDPTFGRNRSVQKPCVLPSAKARVQKKKLANRLAANGFQDQIPLGMEQVCTEPMWASNASGRGSAKTVCQPVGRRCSPRHFPNRPPF